MSKKAFLIGKSTKGLKFAEKDISLMKECLTKLDYEIYIPQQIKPSIIDMFDEFIDEVKQVDTVLFYYSGHGHLEYGDLFLVFEDEIEKSKSKIEISYFLKRIDKSYSSNKLIILDCCNGLNIGDEWKPSLLSRSKIITSSGRLESAKELEEFEASYFTYIFHETLSNPQEVTNQDGEILLDEFYLCLQKKTIRYNENSHIKVPIPNLIGNSQSNFAIAHLDKYFLDRNSHENNNQIFVNLPDPEHELFIGRDAELNELFGYLLPNFTRKSILIYGFGGVGKTALAIEAAKQCWESKDNKHDKNIPKFDSIIYVTFKDIYLRPDGIRKMPNTQSSLEDIFREIIEIYNITFINELSEKDKITRIYQLLKKQRNLLIIDNIDALSEDEQKKVISFIDYIPLPTKVIMTSRWQISSPISIKINSLNRADSIKLIYNQFEQKQLELNDPSKIASCLYDKFQGIPIALICAVGQLALNYPIESVLDTHQGNEELERTPEELAFFCFENSIKQIKGKPAHKILMAMALFSGASSKKAITQVSAVGGNFHIIDNALAMLDRLSLIVKDGDRYDLVSILREYIRSDLEIFDDFEIKARKRWVDWCIKYVKTHGGYDLRNWRHGYHKLEIEWNNILSVLTWCKLNNRYEDIKKIWVSIDCYVDLVGHWNMRIDWWIYVKENSYIFNDTKMHIRSMVDLGWTYTLLGSDHSQLAKNEYNQALKNFSEATPETRITLCRNIAILRMTQNKYHSVLLWLNKSNAILSEFKPKLQNHLDLRFSIINRYYISEAHYKLEKFVTALDLFKEVVKDAEQYGWDRIANYANNYLGQIYIIFDNLVEARLCLESGLIEAKKSQESRRIALYQLSLALLEEKEGNVEMVKKYSADALKVFRSSVMREEREIAEALLERLIQ
jgi:DNA polymerase III delta prime subunit